jgi:hypothetical protein
MRVKGRLMTRGAAWCSSLAVNFRIEAEAAQFP